MITRTETFEMPLTPEEIAAQLANMNSEEQALFFNEFARQVGAWEKQFCFQMQYVSDEPCLTPEARSETEYLMGLFDSSDDYPEWVCSSCGAQFGLRRCGEACWHVGTCGICGIEASVTEPRDFGHLQTGWRARYEQEAANAAKEPPQ